MLKESLKTRVLRAFYEPPQQLRRILAPEGHASIFHG